MKRTQIVIFILALVLTMELLLPSCTQEKPQPRAQTEVQTMQAEPENSDYPLLEIAFEAIDDIVSADIAHGFPSAQIAVMKDGKMLYESCWGLANSYNENGERLETGVPVTEDTLYDLASNTKMYAVIYAVQYLVSQGALDLDTPVVDILGDGFAEDVIDISYEQGERVDREEQIQWKRSITVREVLSHQAGFPPSLHYYDPHYDVSKRISGPEYENVLYQGMDFEKSDIPELLFRTPLMKKPGGEPLYSDIGYMLMTFILEKVTGKPLDVFLSEVFWEPMGLDHIAYTPLAYGFSADQIAATELHGNTRDFLYDFDGIRTHTLQGEVHDECAYYTMGGVSGHAGLFASAGDLARLCSLMLDGTYQGKRYFTDEVLDEFSAPVAPEYPGQGIGWMRRGEDGSNTVYFGENSPPGIIGHQGWTGTLTMIDRENKLILVFLSNKINSPVTRNQYAPDMFDGKWYTTGFGEFIAPMIYAALSAEDETDAKRAVCREFDDCIRILGEIKDAVYALTDDHPASLAYQAICQAKKNFIEAQK